MLGFRLGFKVCISASGRVALKMQGFGRKMSVCRVQQSFRWELQDGALLLCSPSCEDHAVKRIAGVPRSVLPSSRDQ